jgi:hypothetical protein
MRPLILLLIILIQAVFAPTAAAAPAKSSIEGLKADGSLDKAKISKAYFEGDFDMVVTALESWRKMQPNPTKEDKIYVYKYLSVIYAANAETRPKAESYMYQLLKLMPSIELMDLYISDNIEAIFNSVRLRFEHQSKLAADSGQGNHAPASAVATAKESDTNARPYRANPDADKMPERKTGKNETPASKGKSHWGMWTAGVVGVAVVAAGYFVLSQPVRTASAPIDTIEF